MIPPVAASMISSAFSAACCFSILAISGMSEPSSRSRSATGSRSAAVETKETASRSTPCSTANSTQPRSPSVVAGAGRAGDVHPLVGGERAADLDLAVDPAVGLGLAHPEADRAVGEVDQLVLAQRGDARPGDRDRLAVALDLRPGSGSRASRSPARRRRRAASRSAASAPAGRRAPRPRARPVSAASRIASIVRAWRSRSAWEKLRRKTSAPASISCSRTGGVPARRADRGDDLRPPAFSLLRLCLHQNDCRWSAAPARYDIDLCNLAAWHVVSARCRTAGPIVEHRAGARCRAAARRASTPLAQILRFNQRQIEFVFGARRRLGEVFRMRTPRSAAAR